MFRGQTWNIYLSAAILAFISIGLIFLLIRMQLQQKNLLKIQKDFVHGMTHELNTACHKEISILNLFLTPTLLRFKCPHCLVRVKPRSLGYVWLVLSALLGASIGFLLVTGQLSPIGALVVGIVSVFVIKLATSIQVANTTELQKVDQSSDGK